MHLFERFCICFYPFWLYFDLYLTLRWGGGGGGGEIGLWGTFLSILFQDHRNLGNHGALNFGCCAQSSLNGDPMAAELIELMFQGWRSQTNFRFLIPVN